LRLYKTHGIRTHAQRTKNKNGSPLFSLVGEPLLGGKTSLHQGKVFADFLDVMQNYTIFTSGKTSLYGVLYVLAEPLCLEALSGSSGVNVGCGNGDGVSGDGTAGHSKICECAISTVRKHTAE
jgi:hypothetical protein